MHTEAMGRFLTAAEAGSLDVDDGLDDLVSAMDAGVEAVTATPVRALDLAAALVRKAHERGRTLDKLQLQKLTYFAQMLSLRESDQPLFLDKIEPWPMGPVVRVVYNNQDTRGNTVTGVRGSDPSRLAAHPTADAVLADVLDRYGDLSGVALSDLSHIDDGAWEEARSGLEDDEKTDMAMSVGVLRAHAKRMQVRSRR